MTVFDTVGWGVFALAGGLVADKLGVQTVFFWSLVVLMLVNAVWISRLYVSYPRDAARMTATLEERRLLALSAAAPTVDPNPCR